MTSDEKLRHIDNVLVDDASKKYYTLNTICEVFNSKFKHSSFYIRGDKNLEQPSMSIHTHITTSISSGSKWVSEYLAELNKAFSYSPGDRDILEILTDTIYAWIEDNSSQFDFKDYLETRLSDKVIARRLASF